MFVSPFASPSHLSERRLSTPRDTSRTLTGMASDKRQRIRNLCPTPSIYIDLVKDPYELVIYEGYCATSLAMLTMENIQYPSLTSSGRRVAHFSYQAR